MNTRQTAGSLCGGLLCVAVTALAQLGTGSIVGTVVDPTGAAIVGAHLTVADTGTDFKRELTSGTDGNFVVENLKPGEYQIVVSTPGFKEKTVRGITLHVADRARVDIGMEIGQVTDKVSIESQAPVVPTDTASIGEVIGATPTRELPLDGRNFIQLATLTPGVQPGNKGYMALNGGGVSVNGASDTATLTYIDGVQNQSDADGHRMNVSPSPDMIQEFKIQSNSYEAQYGHTGGAQIEIITKRGLRQYHGSAYEFLRNDNLDARPFFQPGNLPEFKRNQFGGTFGGPIPRSQKDFFFFSYEGLRESRGLTAVLTVPPLSIRTGDFTSTGTTIYDPATLDKATNKRQPFPNNQVPPNRISPQAQYFLKYWPAPQTPGFAANYVANPVQTDSPNQYSIRYDRDFSPSDTLTVRYTRNNASFLFPRGLNPLATPLPGFGEIGTIGGENHKAGWTHIFSPTSLNTFNFGFGNFQQNRVNELTGQNILGEAGIQGIKPERQKDGFPTINVSGWTSLANDFTAPQIGNANTFTLDDIFSKISGKHSWKAGVGITRLSHAFDIRVNTVGGSIGFSPRYTTAGPSQPGNQFNAFADYLLGTVAGSFYNDNNISLDLRTKWTHAFVQDTWNVSKSLTVTLGLRYEIFHRPYDTKDRISAVDIVTQKWVFPGTVPTLPGTPPNSIPASQIGVGRSLGNQTRYNNFGPRVGFAWRVFGNDKTVLRGGYGVFYNFISEEQQVLMQGPPFVNSISNPTSPDVPSVFFSRPFGSAVGIPSSGNAIVRDNRTPYIQQYSLGIARALSSNWGSEVNYVGNAGRKNIISYQFNQPVPGPGSCLTRVPYPAFGCSGLSALPTWGTSNYNALQATVRRSSEHGLFFLASYSFAKDLGNSVAGPFTEGQPIRDFRNFKADYGPITGYDLRHIFSASTIYELPFGTGKLIGQNLSRPVSLLIGGWKVGAIGYVHSGYTLTSSDLFDNSNSGGSRPDQISDPNGFAHPSKADGIAQWFNTAAFRRASLFSFGNAGVGTILGPEFFNLDLSLNKDFRISEGKRVQFRTEFFNALNHPNFGNPNTTFGSSTFGRITSTVGNAREIQFGIRIDF